MICVIGWLARLGYVADLLSKPVLTGYMAGIAVLMIVSQLGKVTGMKVPSGSTLSEVGYVVTHLGLDPPAHADPEHRRGDPAAHRAGGPTALALGR